MKSYRVLLYYWFCDIADPSAYAAAHRAKCEELDLRGRILIAEEGINGTCSGTTDSCDAYMRWLSSDERFAGIEFKVEEAVEHAFKKLFIRVRPEIITLGEVVREPVHRKTGIPLDPVQWREMMNRDDVVILDGRNDYEYNVGRFAGAICPPVESFRELPDWLRQHRRDFEGKKILTYCTGGIRCEKLTAWMLQEGFRDVYQLHGGIVRYGQDPMTQGEGFQGINVVFDDRVAVSAGEKSQPLTVCRECGEPTTNYVNCANVLCNDRILLCDACEIVTRRTCSEGCRAAPRLREKDQKLQRA